MSKNDIKVTFKAPQGACSWKQQGGITGRAFITFLLITVSLFMLLLIPACHQAMTQELNYEQL